MPMGQGRHRMRRTVTFCWVAAVILVMAWAAAVCADSLPANRTTRLVASVPTQARVNVNAAGQIVSIFNTTDGTGVRPSILNVYCDGVKIAITPQIAQELDKASSKIDWRRGGVVYDTSASAASPRFQPLTLS